MKLNTFISGFITALLFVFGAILFNHGCQRDNAVIDTEIQVKTVYDTIPVFIDTPIPRDSVVIRYATVKVPVYDTIRSHYADTPFSDSVSVSLPITQKVYKDSTYEAWVSGYNPALDSIRVFSPVTTITNTVTNSTIKYKAKRWGLGVQVGIGFTPSKIEPYIGIGISYNILSW